MKKQGKRICALLLVLMMGLSMAACGGSGTGDGEKNGDGTEEIDKNCTQLYVFNFAGGYGMEWLQAVKERYEELHKDDVYEEGKKGIQIVINNNKTNGSAIADQILYNKDEVYFTEYAFYYALKQNGSLGDITEAVTADLSEYGDAAGTTLVDKLSEEQQDFYGVEEDGETHYYGLPHYAGYTGLVYNVDLFEQEKYYFAKGVTNAQSLEDYFIARSTDERSAGPDGEYGTSDDGLPATFEEFFILCEYIAEAGQTPVSWLGSEDTYLRLLTEAVATNVEGLEQTMLNYTMNGTATTLGTATKNGFVADSGATKITAANGYELLRQGGKYYALDFLNRLTSNDKYHNSLSFNSAYSHMNAQEDFLYAGNDGGQTAPIAMLVEGVWWENEASATFKEMEDSMGEDFAKESRNFAFMPLPKASADDLGKNTLCDHIYSMCFMKANVEEWKKPIAMDFIKFANSDASLVEFTQITNTPKALQYTMTEEQMEGMTTFGKSVMELQQRSDIVYPYSSESIYVNNSGTFRAGTVWSSMVGGKTYSSPVAQFYEGTVSLWDYFSGMKAYYKDSWGQFVY